MDLRDYFMDELWPLMTLEQQKELLEIATILSMYAPTQANNTPAKNED